MALPLLGTTESILTEAIILVFAARAVFVGFALRLEVWGSEEISSGDVTNSEVTNTTGVR